MTPPTVRQEIYKLMLRARSYEEIEGQNSEYFTNEVIQVMIKSIDHIKMELYGNSGWVSACVRMKEELNKK